MKFPSCPKIITAFVISLSTFFCSSVVRAQDRDAEGSKGVVLPTKTSPGPAKAKTIIKERTVYKEKIVIRTPTTGSVAITAPLNTQITLTGAGNNEVEAQDTIGTEGKIIYNRLAPGEYLVTASLAEHKTDIKKVTVKKNDVDAVGFDLTPITYDVNINLNDSIDGTVMYRQGNDAPRALEIQNGRAVLRGLRAGKYDVMLRPAAAAYAPLDDTIEVSAERLNHDFVLKNRLSSGEFTSAAAGDWDMPGGWQFASRMLRTSGPGMAWPQDKGKRHYEDFQLTAVVKMVNGVAASLAVHAGDPQNYYLIQLTGENADERYVLRGFIIKDGVERRFGQTHRINHFAEALKPDKFVHVHLTMRDNVISVEVVDSDSAERLPAGTLVDPDRTYRIGAVGVVVRKDEQMHIPQFTVSPQRK